MTQHQDYVPLLETLTGQYLEILTDNFVGLYVHGSIAMDCFSWARSDIDLIVVVDRPLPQQDKLRLLAVLEALRPAAPEKGFEMSVVLRQHCTHFVYPTPYELHYSNGWLARYLDNPLSLCGNEVKTDADLAAHFTVLLHHGITMYGPPIAELFGPVPKECYLDSIWLDIQNAKEDIAESPVYIILNLCRVLAFCQEGLVLSKKQGGEWGLLHVPLPYRALIQDALDHYLSGTAVPASTDSLRIAYCEYMLKTILQRSKNF